MSAFADLVRFRATLGSTTDWVVSTAIGGCQIPSAANVLNGTNYKVYAVSDDLTQWEISTGAYNSGTTTFPRTTVLYNSSGTGTATGQSGAGTKINFTLAPQVSVVALAEDLISVETANSFTATQQAQARTNVYAAPFDALAYNGMQINGSMEIDQEHAGASSSVSGVYMIDSWISLKNGTMVCTAQQVADAPAGLTNSLKITVGTAEAAIGAGDYLAISQRIEGFRTSRLALGTANAQSITVGFWTKIHRTGAYSGAIINGASNRSYPFSFTQNVADTWEYKTVTISGDVTGTWVGNTNGIGLQIFFTMAVGATFTGTANTWTASFLLGVTGTTNGVEATTDVFQITGVVILPGTEAPSSARSPFIMRPVDQELILCQRHLRKSFPQGTACAQNAGVAGAITIKNPIALGDPSVYVPFFPIMRATPTITTFNPSAANANWRDITAASDATVSVDPATTIGDAGFMIATSGTVTTLGDILAIHYKADARL
jgi:hypothetical protein